MRAEIKALHQRLKTTTVYVTHDQIEAMTMADRIVVMHDGVHRADRHAARALRPAGQPVRRAVHRLAGDEHRARARCAATNGDGARRDAGRRPLAARRGAPAPTARPVAYGVRPEHLDARRRRASAACPARSSSSSRPAPKPSCSCASATRRSSSRRTAAPTLQPGDKVGVRRRSRQRPPVRSGERRRARRLRQIPVTADTVNGCHGRRARRPGGRQASTRARRSPTLNPSADCAITVAKPRVPRRDAARRSS